MCSHLQETDQKSENTFLKSRRAAMGENDNKKTGSQPKNIEDVMHERERLDKILKKDFTKKMTILFTDVCGYTKFMDTRGDIAGRAWMQKHHDIVLPLVEEHGGKVLDIMGDGVMASFENTLSAVKASVAIQKGLNGYNKETGPADEIHVTMGINTGEILVDSKHIAGDVVNVASRIETQAGQDQILISKSAYEDVCGSEDILCRAHGSVSVKGKAEPLNLYRVVWQDEDIVLSADPRVRAQEKVPEKRAKTPLKVLQLEITREENRLKISAYEQSTGEVNTVRHYEEIPVSIEKIGERCREIVGTLNNANRKGRLNRDVLVKLREIGQVFRDELFTLNVKNRVSESEADHLILNLDDQLVHVPWELLHDGKQFLCQRFNMGRLVKTRQAISDIRTRLLARPLKMLVLADPKGDLKGAYEEGTLIRDFMDQDKDLVSVSLLSDNITPDFIREKIRNFDLIHYAGHADYDPENPAQSGWRLSEGVIRAEEINKMAGTAAMPALIFSNACQSARTEEWGIDEDFQDEIFGLANAFILAGVKHYVGTFWEILDEPSKTFALKFYKNLLKGMTMGEAVKMARMELIDKYGEETIVWASYLLYGDPTFNYMDQIRDIEITEEEPQKTRVRETQAGPQRGSEKITFGEKEVKKRSRAWWGAIAAAAVLAFLLWGYPGFMTRGTGEYERSAKAFYQAGNYPEAVNVCETLREKNPGLRLPYVILGNIQFIKGDLNQAGSNFRKALESKQGTDEQKADALMGLGRIASIEKKTDDALKYYQQASQLAPGTAGAYVSQAILLDNQGQYEQALPLLKKAGKLAPQDSGIRVMTGETQKMVSISKDGEKQEKIDRLVQELLKDFEKAKAPAPSDGWTSVPLTLWIMDLETRGNSLQEGKEKIIASGIMGQLLEKSRVRIVERAVLDKLLEELKLGTTALVDRSTALSLGKIVAARLILSGQVIHAVPESQVTLRLIETETGQVTAAVTEAFGSAVPASLMADKLSASLLKKVKERYPLRGKISEVKGDKIILNIGQNQGVKVGQQFKLKDTDLVMEIVGVQPEICTAKIGEGGKGIQKGLRVETINE
jgi:class 3 adenylate cyclase/CHAT domain-containing protein/tetratricopeptide (TPR) repeat protein